MLDTAKPTDVQADTLLEVNNIEVIYNHVILVLKGVSLKVPKGGITALLGGNGAGKTTTLKAVSNLLHSERGAVTKGSILYRGDRVQDLAPAVEKAFRYFLLGAVIVFPVWIVMRMFKVLGRDTDTQVPDTQVAETPAPNRET